ncbi:MAG: T9SS type A sorting domain-containing protein [Saprospiraceae bacterium]
MKNLYLIFGFFLLVNVVQAHTNNDAALSCDVTITAGTLVGLTATATGTAPFQYLWNGVVTNETFYPVTAGEYCVNVVDATGCTAEACFDWAGAPVGTACAIELTQTSDVNYYNNASLEIIEISNPVDTIVSRYWDNGTVGKYQLVNIPGEYCVTVIYESGCIASDCFTWDPACQVSLGLSIHSKIEASSNGYGMASYLWNTNETDYMITPANAGTYCVTVTYDNGCVATECIDWSPDFLDECEVWIEELSYGNNNTQLRAHSDNPNFQWSTGPFTYLWSTGETTQAIQPTAAGSYCVTVIDTVGCQGNVCFDWVPDAVCSATILPVGIDMLEAQPSGIAPYTYAWDDGSTTQSVVVYMPTGLIKCVEITDATGCKGNACYDAANHYFSANGNIVLLDVDTTQTADIMIDIFLIKYDVVLGTLTAVDQQVVSKTSWEIFSSVDPQDGSVKFPYTFENLDNCAYLIKAAMRVNSSNYANYIPTYYGDILFWNNSPGVSFPQTLGSTYDITMIQGINPGGPGFVGGFVSEGANLMGGATPRGEGDPIENAVIMLLDENGQAVAYTFSDADGNFSFGDLPWGTYQLYIEVLGVEPNSVWVTIGPDDETIDNVSFVVNSNNIEVVVTNIEELIETATVRLFPNPTQAELYLELVGKTATQGYISINNLQGQTISTQVVNVEQGHQYLQLEVATLTPGMYFLNLELNGEVISKKMIKQ